MEYSERFKAEMVQKMMGPSAMSANRLSKENGVGQPTLSRWLREAKLEVMKRSPKSAVRKHWTASEKLRVVLAAAGAGEAGRGEVMRREGLHEADLSRFEQELAGALRNSGKTGQTKRDPADKKRIQELEREVRRKDKALAEATALVVLSKKLKAYFAGDEVGDTNPETDE